MGRFRGRQGGLLIDTLAYNFLKSTSDYDSKSYLYYDEMVRDFFKYLANEPDKDHYQALGSNQDEPTRVFRRQFILSHATLADSSNRR